jgi:hypothetical protein
MRSITSFLALSAIITTSLSVALPEPKVRITIDITAIDASTDTTHQPFSMGTIQDSVDNVLTKQTSAAFSQTVFNPKTSDDNDDKRSLPGSFTISIDSKFPLLVDTSGGDNYGSETRLLNTGSSDATVLTLSDGMLRNSDGWVAAWPYPVDRTLNPKRLVFRDLSMWPPDGAVEFRVKNTTDGCSLVVVGDCQ